MQEKISFVLDGKKVSIDFSKEKSYTPTTTVLNYLRSTPTHKGVKEGCAEGDCGACTVALGSLDENGNLQYTAWDSCLLFLPMIHGKQLITVENLAKSNGVNKLLHPVQQAMVNTDGSQCGYCTPGIVMSLFALYKNEQNPSRESIDDALTGNLCRCTGYRPIIEAAMEACKGGADQFDEEKAQIVRLLKEIKSDKETIALKTKQQTFYKPFTVEAALKLKSENPDALLINGATDIALRVTKNKELLPEIIDISAVLELKSHHSDEQSVTFGAGLSLEAVKGLSEKRLSGLYKMLEVFGSRQIRTAATLGGNLGTASPIGDTTPVLMAYNAEVELQGKNGTRTVNVNDFIKGYRQTDCQSDELITRVIVPVPRNGETVMAYKVSKRKDLDISTVSSGFGIQLKDNQVEEARLAFGGMAAMTKRALKTEAFLTGKEWSRENVEKAMEILYEEFTPITDARSGDEMRRIAAKNLLLKFWSETAAVPAV